MRDIDHVVGVYSSERRQTVTHDGKERHQDVINDVDNVKLFAANIDPPCASKISLLIPETQKEDLPIKNSTHARPNKVMRVA